MDNTTRSWRMILKVAPRQVFSCVVLLGLLASPLAGVNVYAQKSTRAADDAGLSLPEGRQGVEYDFRFESDGGLAPLKWRVVGGELPPGLTLESSGRLQGLPAAARREAYQFVVEASDSAVPPQQATQSFLLLIQAAPLRIKNPTKVRIQPPPSSGGTTSDALSVPVNLGAGAGGVVGAPAALTSSNTPAATSGHSTNVPPAGQPDPLEGDDIRENFEATGYIGVGVDSFAAGDIKNVLNPRDTSERKERFVAGFDFAYRLFGDPVGNGKWKKGNQQLWFYGGTTHGVRSADVDCQAKSEVCKDVFDVTATPQRFFYILRNASSLEGFMGVRWEFAQVNKLLASSARAYLKAQAGFLTMANGIDDVYDIHHVAAGLIATKGRFQNSYLEIGFGRTDLFKENRRRRFKIDGYLSWGVPGMEWLRPFAQINVDTDLRRGSDSVQSYFGFDFDLRCLFNSAACR